nr:arabinogalactan protein 1-like [Aegilops tauschii subsp. strangulata]
MAAPAGRLELASASAVSALVPLRPFLSTRLLRPRAVWSRRSRSASRVRPQSASPSSPASARLSRLAAAALGLLPSCWLPASRLRPPPGQPGRLPRPRARPLASRAPVSPAPATPPPVAGSPAPVAACSTPATPAAVPRRLPTPTRPRAAASHAAPPGAAVAACSTTGHRVTAPSPPPARLGPGLPRWPVVRPSPVTARRLPLSDCL